MKCFMWKVPWGAIPTGIKVRVRGIGTDVCSGCRVALEDPLHLFLKCPMVLGLICKVCKWVQRSLKIPCSKEDLILGGGVMANEAVLSCTQVLRFFLLKHIWQARNGRVFENKLESPQLKDIIQDSVQALFEIGLKIQIDVWKETITRVCSFENVYP